MTWTRVASSFLGGISEKQDETTKLGYQMVPVFQTTKMVICQLYPKHLFWGQSILSHYTSETSAKNSIWLNHILLAGTRRLRKK